MNIFIKFLIIFYFFEIHVKIIKEQGDKMKRFSEIDFEIIKMMIKYYNNVLSKKKYNVYFYDGSSIKFSVLKDAFFKAIGINTNINLNISSFELKNMLGNYKGSRAVNAKVKSEAVYDAFGTGELNKSNIYKYSNNKIIIKNNYKSAMLTLNELGQVTEIEIIDTSCLNEFDNLVAASYIEVLGVNYKDEDANKPQEDIGLNFNV